MRSTICPLRRPSNASVTMRQIWPSSSSISSRERTCATCHASNLSKQPYANDGGQQDDDSRALLRIKSELLVDVEPHALRMGFACSRDQEFDVIGTDLAPVSRIP
ncbi:protein of unknown function [Burkholderia multivorans]